MSYYTQAVETWLRSHAGRDVTTFHVAELFRDANVRAATQLIAINGFKKAGIWPMNRHVFGDHDFMAAAPTDIRLDTESETDEPEQQQLQADDNHSDFVVDEPHHPEVGLLDSPDPQQPSCSYRPLEPRRSSGRRGKTAVITESPYNKQVEDKANAVSNKTTQRLMAKKSTAKTRPTCEKKIKRNFHGTIQILHACICLEKFVDYLGRSGYSVLPVKIGHTRSAGTLKVVVLSVRCVLNKKIHCE